MTLEFLGYLALWLVFTLIGVAALRAWREEARDWTPEVALIVCTTVLFTAWMLTRP